VTVRSVLITAAAVAAGLALEAAAPAPAASADGSAAPPQPFNIVEEMKKPGFTFAEHSRRDPFNDPRAKSTVFDSPPDTPGADPADTAAKGEVQRLTSAHKHLLQAEKAISESRHSDALKALVAFDKECSADTIMTGEGRRLYAKLKPRRDRAARIVEKAQKAAVMERLAVEIPEARGQLEARNFERVIEIAKKARAAVEGTSVAKDAEVVKALATIADLQMKAEANLAFEGKKVTVSAIVGSEGKYLALVSGRTLGQGDVIVFDAATEDVARVTAVTRAGVVFAYRGANITKSLY
jgi:hypothetical protein